MATTNPYKKYQDVNSQLDVLKNERNKLMQQDHETSDLDHHKELLQKIKQLEYEISSKEHILRDMSIKDNKLLKDFEALKAKMDETTQTTANLLQQNAFQREQNQLTDQTVNELKVQLHNEEQRKVSVSSQIEDIEQILQEGSNELVEDRIAAIEEVISSSQDQLNKSDKMYYSETAAKSNEFSTRTHANIINHKNDVDYEDKEIINIRESRHKRSLSSTSKNKN